MQVRRVEACYLTNVPITPLPLLKEPSRASIVVLEIETDDGIIGYGSTGGHLLPSIVEFINREATLFLRG